MTVQHRRRASYKKAIDDILDEDETAFPPMWHITEQLTAKFPNITPPPGLKAP
eukprot:COSAG05_NODE_853_length_6963_cov_5.582314_9_plen_53_part_00